MPGTVIGKQLNVGYAGKVSRSNDRIIINRMYDITNEDPVAFGAPIFLDVDGKITGTTTEQFVGIAAASVVQSTIYGEQGNAGEYYPGKPMDIMVRGTVTVAMDSPAAQVAGAKVYFDGAKKLFTGESTGTVEIPGAHFATGYVDANNNAEIVLTTRNLI